MEDALNRLGLNQKEVEFYLYLIKSGTKNASALATELGETRTNTYMILDRLVSLYVVEVDDSHGVRKYSASDPTALKRLLLSKQNELKKTHQQLTAILPELSSLYSLTQHKPGVVQLEGLEGYRTSQEEMARSGQPIDVIASDVVPENKEAEKILLRATDLRKKAGTPARILFHESAKEWLDPEVFKKRGYDIRLWGKEPIEGEMAIYGAKVVLTVYKPALILTVITNQILADTFRSLFNSMWENSNELASSA